MADFRWFQVVSLWFQMVLGGFRWFQVVPCFSKYEWKHISLKPLLKVDKKISEEIYKIYCQLLVRLAINWMSKELNVCTVTMDLK